MELNATESSGYHISVGHSSKVINLNSKQNIIFTRLLATH